VARERGGRALKVLVLGGTLFVGRHLVEAVLDRGDEVTVFNRGQTGPELYPEVERLRGDRHSGDLEALRNRSWDAVVDTSARVPRWVRDSTELLADRIGHYTFVSSGSVYADTSSPGTDESSPVHRLEDEAQEEITSAEVYGGLKVLCEREAERALPGRVLVVRAGLIVGPYDPTGRFTYWVHRIAGGGDVLVPEPRDQHVQLVHARDLANWILELAEQRRTGVFNATGPAEPLTMEQLVEAIREETGSDARPIWVDEGSLVERGVEAWSDLPLWLAPGTNPETANFLAVDVSRALAAGLRFRPLAETIRDTLEQAETSPAAGLDPARERALLAR
jgi:2'-hydroxyisoflavone reductase